MTQDTITETRTETTTREIVKHRCPLCETYHEGDDLAKMWVGGHETELCRYCAASVLDVEAEAIDVTGAADTETTSDGRSRLAGALTTIVTTGIVATIGVLVASEVMSSIPAEEVGEVTQVGAPLFTLADLVPVVLLILTVLLFIKASAIMPRM